ncbi:hypothetical protein HN695_03330 [Candidatus Woesearchaeota archaeon]|jgi:hypothetical protein|nr:hypothetical protein [Candidatus Woesearchaeota archaeon]MBT5272017.1 hypothetical protein [Candidatus Woesearchaeota archaeon]MBT6040758.1 hypothetical protein [Candidatus Woesearchaeota archaeon]MBT6336710.1 hypothetical protein [Candidatus Woesearchaeota archaeon]MBT7927343.1 hypothetical protein [Candidatus Woesearchaeota archaeon]
MVDDGSSSKSKLVFLVTTVVIIGLLMLLVFMSMRTEFETQDVVTEADSQGVQTLAPDEEESVGLVGQAISGFTSTMNDANPYKPQPDLLASAAAFNPATGYVAFNSFTDVANKFTIDIIAHPEASAYPDIKKKCNYFTFKFGYNPKQLNFNVNSGVKFPDTGVPFYVDAINDIPINADLNEVVVEARAVSVTDFFTYTNADLAITDLTLAEIEFTPIYQVDDANTVAVTSLVRLLDISFPGNSLNPDNTDVDTLFDLAGFLNSKIYFRMEYFEDSDGDLFGNPGVTEVASTTPAGYVGNFGDCDDDMTDDPVGICPADSDHCTDDTGACAVCIYPGAPEICDNMITDCNMDWQNEANLCFNMDQGDPECEGNLEDCENIVDDLQKDLYLCQATSTPVPDTSTPSCGNGICDAWEHALTCPVECPSLITFCETTCVDDMGNGCMCDDEFNENCDTICIDPVTKEIVDDDGDMIPDPYEATLDQIYFNVGTPDTDGDGVLDNRDFCPNTDTFNNVFKLATGEINVLGCYSPDVAVAGAGVRPDGCFTNKDITVLLGLYNKNTATCTALIG